MFVMRAEYTLDTLLTPTSDSIELRELPARRFAVGLF